MSHTDNLITAAHEYLSLGLSVIALNQKMPNGQVHPHGLKDAIAHVDPQVIERAFGHRNTTGIGILTGLPLYVIDIDGEEGAKQWTDIAGTTADATWTAKTGRGLHLYFNDFAAEEERRTSKLGPKLDFKGVGGYVAAPPSLHPDGHYYEWILSPHESYVMELPDGLRAVLDRNALEREARLVTKQGAKLLAKSPLDGGKFYAVATFGGIIERVRNEPAGNRNAVLYWAARTMLEQGADEEDLTELYEAAIESGLTHRESRLTIRSAVNA